MAEATKAYYVVENWSVGKAMIVWANSAREAKRKVREPAGNDADADVEVMDQVDPYPKGIAVRRMPSEDREGSSA
jgi:hypothetical protein